MSKLFYLSFGNQNPASYTGLSPTFTLFSWNGLTALVGPTITELPVGSGIYQFQAGTTQSIAFVCDGGMTLANNVRYIVGSLDPVLSIDQTIGYATDSFGNTATDPTTLFGQAKRNQEFNEGDKVFTKATGLWDIFNRGSSTLLIEKSLTNTTTQATS